MVKALVTGNLIRRRARRAGADRARLHRADPAPHDEPPDLVEDLTASTRGRRDGLRPLVSDAGRRWVFHTAVADYWRNDLADYAVNVDGPRTSRGGGAGVRDFTSSAASVGTRAA